jgi:hypothetical protein
MIKRPVWREEKVDSEGLRPKCVTLRITAFRILFIVLYSKKTHLICWVLKKELTDEKVEMEFRKVVQ